MITEMIYRKRPWFQTRGVLIAYDVMRRERAVEIVAYKPYYEIMRTLTKDTPEKKGERVMLAGRYF